MKYGRDDVIFTIWNQNDIYTNGIDYILPSKVEKNMASFDWCMYFSGSDFVFRYGTNRRFYFVEYNPVRNMLFYSKLPNETKQMESIVCIGFLDIS